MHEMVVVGDDLRDLALEVAHLMHPGSAITGEIRHVDGGYHALGAPMSPPEADG